MADRATESISPEEAALFSVDTLGVRAAVAAVATAAPWCGSGEVRWGNIPGEVR